MPWQLLIWLLAFILQSGLLGINLWKLVQLTDLEADFLNPHDASKSYNKLVVRARSSNLPVLFFRLRPQKAPLSCFTCQYPGSRAGNASDSRGVARAQRQLADRFRPSGHDGILFLSIAARRALGGGNRDHQRAHSAPKSPDLQVRISFIRVHLDRVPFHRRDRGVVAHASWTQRGAVHLARGCFDIA
jgi:hypothetical protein